MPPRINTPKNIKIAGELRRSQTITTFGCGALVDFPRFSGIIAGIDDWKINKCVEIQEPNLAKLLGVDKFYEVSPAAPNMDNKYDLSYEFSMPAYRFPEWYYCPNCGALNQYWKISRPTNGNTSDYNGDLFCNHCEGKIKLVPSRFVVSCINGHIHDFPYVWWVHKGKGICDNPRLTLKYKGNTGGLDSIHIKCETCNAETTMANCLGKESLNGFRCNGDMPWLGKENYSWIKDPIPCDSSVRALQRSANNVYYSVNQSALTIPPYSEKMYSAFRDNDAEWFRNELSGDDEDFKIKLLKKCFDKYSSVFNGDFDKFKSFVYKMFGGEEEPSEIDLKKLRESEYEALTGPDENSRDAYQFRTYSENVPEEFRGLISQIKMVTKLREVIVLQGFRRILPEIDATDEEKKELGINRDFAPISKKTPPTWLPATQMFGEGIFIAFDEEAVSKWENINKDRYTFMANNHKQSWIGHEMFNHEKPRYVLLHTFAHLFIRQLSARCGYATASVKEKIYSTFENGNVKMSGVLIYTSATDTDGSLGGLVREGCSEKVRDTILELLEQASWCSNDPICIESKSQGFKSLNYASCHACTLLPETSCESLNCLLDRAAIVGLPEDKNIAFFRNLL